MCIIFLAAHHICTHRHFIGSYKCGCDCATDARHIFLLYQGNDVPCATCCVLNREVLDPEIRPVQWMPALHGIRGVKAHVKTEKNRKDAGNVNDGKGAEDGKDQDDKEDEEEEGINSLRRSIASLSDVDSDTEYWKLEPLTLIEQAASMAASADQASYSDEQPEAPVEATPIYDYGNEKQEEIPTIPSTPGSVKKHRDLIKKQLKQLPNDIGHRRQLTNESVNLLMGGPVAKMPVIPTHHRAQRVPAIATGARPPAPLFATARTFSPETPAYAPAMLPYVPDGPALAPATPAHRPPAPLSPRAPMFAPLAHTATPAGPALTYVPVAPRAHYMPNMPPQQAPSALMMIFSPWEDSYIPYHAGLAPENGAQVSSPTGRRRAGRKHRRTNAVQFANRPVPLESLPLVYDAGTGQWNYRISARRSISYWALVSWQKREEAKWIESMVKEEVVGRRGRDG